MLGLQRGTVRLVPHDDTWPQEAARTIRQLREILGATAVDIQHVGSTAIPLIEAKPILDLAVGVRALADLQPALPALERQGFLFRGEMVPGERLLVMGTADTRTHHIHVVVWNGERWRDYLNFRDYLNAHPGKALQYEACKRRLAAQFPLDRTCYTDGKAALIAGLLAEARQWRAENPALHSEPPANQE